MNDFGALGDSSADNFLAFKNALLSLKNAGGGTLIVPAGNYLFKTQISTNGSQVSWANPTLLVSDNITVQADTSAYFLSEVGPAGGWGYNTCLFVNSDQIHGNSNITFSGGAFKVAAQPIKFVGTASSGTPTVTVISGSISNLQIGMGLAGMTADSPPLPVFSSPPVITAINGNQITLNENAARSATSVPMQAGWSGGPFLCMINVNNFNITGGLRLLDSQAWAVPGSNWLAFRTVLSVQNFSINDAGVGYETKNSVVATDYGNEDGFHFFGGTTNGTISNVTGTSGDDFFMFDIEPSGGASPPGSDHSISNVHVFDSTVTSNWGHPFRMMVGPAALSTGTISQMTFNNIVGISNALGVNAGTAGIMISDDSGQNLIGPGIGISDVSINCEHIGLYCLYVNSANGVTTNNLNMTLANAYDVYLNGTSNIHINGALKLPFSSDQESLIATAYYDGFGRTPFAGELISWQNAAPSGVDYGSIIGVIQGAIPSLPSDTLNSIITTAYQTGAGRAPASGEMSTWSNLMIQGNAQYQTIVSAVNGNYLDTNSALQSQPPVKILPLGDSITFGLTTTNSSQVGTPGYRSSLSNILRAQGYSFQLIGSGENGDVQADNDGYSGCAISEITTGTIEAGDFCDQTHSGNGTSPPGIAAILNATNPDVILLQLGTNDLLQPAVFTVSTAPTRLKQLIDTIFTIKPTVQLIVATLPPICPPSNSCYTSVPTFNAAIRTMISNYNASGNRHVSLSDNASAVLSGDLSSDGVHPSYPSGYAKMGVTWARAINSILSP